MSTQAFNLMDLPFTVRLRMLDLCTVPLSREVFLGSEPSISLPVWTRVGSRRLRLETIMIILGKSVVEVRSGRPNEALQEWLSTLDYHILQGDTNYETGFDAVKVSITQY